METAKRKNNFDLIRLLAAFQVVLGHAMRHFHAEVPDWLMFVWGIFPGVPIFFCISGFLIARSVERNRGQMRVYWWARVLRIYPALFLCATLWLVLMGVLGVLNGVSPLKVAQWYGLAVGLGGAAINPDFFRGFGVGVWNGALWTVGIEITFYLFLPVLYLCERHGRNFLNFVFAAACLVSFAVFIRFDGLHFGETKQFGTLDKVIWFSLPGNLWMLLFGTLIHRYFDKLRPYLEGKVLWWLALYVVVSYAGSGRSGTISNRFLAAGVFFTPRVIIALLTVSAAYSFRGVSDFVLRGQDISYGLYIYHMPVFNLFVQYGLGVPGMMVVGLLTALGCGCLSWFGIERRMLALKPQGAPRNVSEPRLTNAERSSA